MTLEICGAKCAIERGSTIPHTLTSLIRTLPNIDLFKVT